MSERSSLVNLLAKRVAFSNSCDNCSDDVFMNEWSYQEFRYLSSSGCCLIFLCEKCYKERECETGRKRTAPKVHKVLPLP